MNEDQVTYEMKVDNACDSMAREMKRNATELLARTKDVVCSIPISDDAVLVMRATLVTKAQPK